MLPISRRLGHVLAALLAIGPLAAQAAAPAPPRLSLPDAHERAAARREIDKVYGARLAQPDAALVAELLAAARDVGAGPARRYEMLATARDAATRCGDDRLALAAAGQQQELFELGIDPRRGALQVIRELGATSTDVWLLQRLVERSIAAADALAETEDFALALDYLTAVQPMAKRSGIDGLDANVRGLAAAIASMRDESAAVAGMDPASVYLGSARGKYLCLYRNRWSLGLPLLAAGANASLRAAAEFELRGPADAAECQKLADLWWSIAAHERGSAGVLGRRHAAHWYRRALEGLQGRAAAPPRKRLEAVAADAAFMPAGDGLDQPRVLVPTSSFMLWTASPTLDCHLAVPTLAHNTGTLFIDVENMGDDSGDHAMYCNLLDADGGQVWRHKGSTDGHYRQRVSSCSSWTLELEDRDSSGNNKIPGNRGKFTVRLVPD